MALTDTEYETLTVLYRQRGHRLVAQTPGATQELADVLGIERQATYQRLKGLCRRRLVRLDKVHSKRIRAIEMTRVGAKAYESERRRRRQHR